MKTPKRVIQDLIEEVAFWHGLTLDDIYAKSRKRQIVYARQDAIARIIIRYPHISYVRVGQIFGGLDHTTVIHAMTRCKVAKRPRANQGDPIARAA